MAALNGVIVRLLDCAADDVSVPAIEPVGSNKAPGCPGTWLAQRTAVVSAVV